MERAFGDQLRLARKRCGYTLRDLAGKLNDSVSAQAISKYERGLMMPSSDVLLALADALRTPIDVLMRPPAVCLQEIRFRKVSGLAARECKRMQGEIADLLQRQHEIEAILGLDRPECKRVRIKPDQAESLAEKVRRDWQLGIDPIPSMTCLLEDRGIRVLAHDLPDKVSGLHCLAATGQSGRTISAIVVNRRHNIERRRMTLAHELFHHLAECSSDRRTEEKAATRFASSLLMPKAHFLAELGKGRSHFGYQEFISFKYMYQVSAAAVLMRLASLEIISQAAVAGAFRSFASTWRKTEPVPLPDEKNDSNHELPRRFERLCIGALSEGLISIRKAVQLLQLPRGVIAAKVYGPKS
ncbi:MAG: XRE family transcriptional regulator [Betaproteobacteria bacterium]|nr:XRE family transcriptional regulator [Betaproteobacteria bacterium]